MSLLSTCLIQNVYFPTRTALQTADSRFTNEAMADEFLWFLEGYTQAENFKSDAIHGNFP